MTSHDRAALSVLAIVAPCRWCGDPVYADGYPHHSVRCLWRLCEVALGAEAFEAARAGCDVVGAMRALREDAERWRTRERLDAEWVASIKAGLREERERPKLGGYHAVDDVRGGGKGEEGR